MKYVEYINSILAPNPVKPELVLDLFAGCGGLSLGFEAAGFKTIGFEMDKAASTSYSNNLTGECFNTKLDLDYNYPKADIVIGGPPCQPFSVGGHQKGIEDSRDGFPIFIDAIKKTNPKLFMFENVRGLLYTNKWYFELILSELQKLGYIIQYKLLNAVNYGVPQNRERLFVIGHRGVYNFPPPIQRKTTVFEAIGDTMYKSPKGSKFLSKSMDVYIAKYEKASHCINPRDLYPDKPARTLTCRNLAGATGDMHRVRLKNGKRRRLLYNEAARLQSFPDWFQFTGNETEVFNQIGNAVPPLLSFHLATSISHTIEMGIKYSKSTIIKKNLSPNQDTTLFDL